MNKGIPTIVKQVVLLLQSVSLLESNVKVLSLPNTNLSLQPLLHRLFCLVFSCSRTSNDIYDILDIKAISATCLFRICQLCRVTCLFEPATYIINVFDARKQSFYVFLLLLGHKGIGRKTKAGLTQGTQIA